MQIRVRGEVVKKGTGGALVNGYMAASQRQETWFGRKWISLICTPSSYGHWLAFCHNLSFWSQFSGTSIKEVCPNMRPSIYRDGGWMSTHLYTTIFLHPKSIIHSISIAHKQLISYTLARISPIPISTARPRYGMDCALLLVVPTKNNYIYFHVEVSDIDGLSSSRSCSWCCTFVEQGGQ